MMPIEIKKASFEDIAAIHNQVPEFTPEPADHFKKRCEGKKFLALAAFWKDCPAGYTVSYDRYGDGSFYLWMAGVVPEYRNKGIYSALFASTEEYAAAESYRALTIKTRNNRRDMLRWLIGNGFDFTAVEQKEPVADSRIYLIKTLPQVMA